MAKEIPKLFSEDLGIAKSDEELAVLQNHFPEYDPGYVTQATAVTRQKHKIWMEGLWRQYHLYADPHFLEDFKRQFTQRSWELYLGATLLNRGFKLGKRTKECPDFDVVDTDMNRQAWIEAVATEKGTGGDKVPEEVYKRVFDVPVEQMRLRISNAFVTKFKQYRTYVEKGVVGADEPYVVAINRSSLGLLDPILPLILKVLFPVGDLALHLPIGGAKPPRPRSSWTVSPKVGKANGSDVSMFYFLNQEYAGISAVIYSADNILNSPHLPEQMGENFTIVYNPLAKNPLRSGFFPFGSEYGVADEYLQKLRDEKPWDKLYPF